jgi:hypothetical protein
MRSDEIRWDEMRWNEMRGNEPYRCEQYYLKDRLNGGVEVDSYAVSTLEFELPM